MGLIVAPLFVMAMILAPACLGLWFGAAAYRGWRRDKREELNEELRRNGWQSLYGPYVSPFPWHRKRKVS